MGPGAHKAGGVFPGNTIILSPSLCEATGLGLGQTQTIIVSVESYNTAMLTLYTTKLSIAVQTGILSLSSASATFPFIFSVNAVIRFKKS